MGYMNKKIKSQILTLKDDQVLVVKIGSEQRPASANDINNEKILLENFFNSKKSKSRKIKVIVTHHVFDIYSKKIETGKNRVIICEIAPNTNRDHIEQIESELTTFFGNKNVLVIPPVSKIYSLPKSKEINDPISCLEL